MDDKVSLKVVLGEDTRKVVMARSSITWDTLSTLLYDLFEVKESFTLIYVDHEGDDISISSTREVEDLIAELGLNLPRLMIRTRPAEGKGKGRIAALIHKFDAAAAIESPADPVMTYSTRRFDSAPPVAVITTAPQVLQVVAPTLTPGKATFDFTSALHDLLQIGRMEVDGAGPEASKNVVDAVEHYAGVIVNDLLKTISDPIARERIAQSVWRRLETLAKANQRHNEIQTVVAQKQQPFVLAGFGSAATKERRDRRNYGKQQGQSGRGGRGGKRAFVNHAQNRSPFPPHKLQGRRHGQENREDQTYPDGW